MTPLETSEAIDTAKANSRKRPPPDATTIIELKLQLQKKRKANIQAALEKAQRKLERAQQQKEHSLVDRPGVVSPSILSALKSSLDLTIHVNNSDPERVLFPCAALPADLGLSQLVPEDKDDKLLEVSTIEEEDPSPPTSSLTQRKRQLQAELQVLKDRLFAKQQQQQGQLHRNVDGDGTIDKTTAISTAQTKESLLQKKQEAKTMMDTSYWKLFVSKQEDWLVQAHAQVNETSQALAACTARFEETQRQRKAAHQELEESLSRHQVVRVLIVETSKSILADRAALCHSEV